MVIVASKKITINEVTRKHIKVVSYLLASGTLGYILARFVARDEVLTLVFAPAINYLLYILKQELDGEGFVNLLRK